MHKKLVWLIVCSSQFGWASAPKSIHDARKIEKLRDEIVEHRRAEAVTVTGYHNLALLMQAEQALKEGKIGAAESHLFCYRHQCPCRPII